MAQVLVIGSGGREQALAWKLAQAQDVNKVYVAPGNGGSQGKIENVDIAFDDVQGLLNFARQHQIELTVVGQETASAAGVVDEFLAAGLVIFGPTRSAVQVEASKTFSKDLMRAQNIPTAEYQNFDNPDEARAYAKSRSLPVVIKADGLAAGKGVIIAYSQSEIDQAIDEIMVSKAFGESGNKVVVEDFLKGQEVSTHALCDGTRTVMFPPSQDHKQAYDNDKGPNTGGMGVYAPVEWIDDAQLQTVKAEVIEPALNGLKARKAEFKGCLYPGLMVDGDDLRVLEFNARFGDPETEVYMRLMDADLYQVLRACALGELDPNSVKWQPGYAVSVVLAAEGYPGAYSKGLPITGIEEAEQQPDIVVFHAGTAIKDGQLVTAGGRVLNVTATADTLDEAINKAYAAIKFIHFDGMFCRRDIGRRSS